MARGVQLTCPVWFVVPCAVLGFGLGYTYASSRRRAKQNPTGSIVRTQPPHMNWTSGEKQPPPEDLDAGQLLREGPHWDTPTAR